jgi:uracil-DNA glycosylase family 4
MSEQSLDALYEAYAGNHLFARLAEGREMVRGHGPHGALAVVGEAPGGTEERTRRPFTGPAGKLFQDIFARAEVPWELCYVTNVVPWRPPGNRTPYPFEVTASQSRLAAELDVVAPVVVVAAGAVAWRGLGAESLGKFEDARFRWHDLNGRRLLALPHPSYIMRLSAREVPEWKKASIDALSLALRVAGT